MILYITTGMQNNNKNPSWAKRCARAGCKSSPLRTPAARRNDAVPDGQGTPRELRSTSRDRDRARLPDFVKDEFDAFLECGILAHGFLRLRCAQCARMRSWWPSPVSGAGFAPRAGRGAWPERGPPGRLRDPAGAGAPMGGFVS